MTLDDITHKQEDQDIEVTNIWHGYHVLFKQHAIVGTVNGREEFLCFLPESAILVMRELEL